MVGNITQGNENIGIVQKGELVGGNWIWSTVAQTEPYPLCNCSYDHRFNGIVISPGENYLFINSGSRSDHGEIQDNNGALALTIRRSNFPATIRNKIFW